MKRWITGLLVFVWMLVIFCFSAQPAEESSQISHSAAYQVAKWQDQLFKQEKTEEELRAQAEAMQVAIRKGAHMCEYALLAILLFFYLNCHHFNKKQTMRIAWALTTCYAATDEFHQLFVPGRAGRFTDVCIDSAGGLLGILLLYLFLGRITDIQKRKR